MLFYARLCNDTSTEITSEWQQAIIRLGLITLFKQSQIVIVFNVWFRNWRRFVFFHRISAAHKKLQTYTAKARKSTNSGNNKSTQALGKKLCSYKSHSLARDFLLRSVFRLLLFFHATFSTLLWRTSRFTHFYWARHEEEMKTLLQ